MNAQNQTQQNIMQKNPNGSFTICANGQTITLTRAQFCQMLGKTPTTLLPKSYY